MDQNPHSPFASGALVADRYRITGIVGRGAMGAVYSAQHVDSGQKVALKFMAAPEAEGADASLRFMQEARVMAELHSPHTIRLYDFGRTADGAMFMAMELLIGKALNLHLKDLAEAGRSMGQVEAADMAIQVLRSLGEAHARGLVHRDLKPGNIFLADDGTGDVLAKVLDFGIARVADSGLTQAGHVLGTPLYMSPEQWRSDPVDGRADLYALGCVLFHCVTGRAPFGSSGNVMALMLQHCDAALPDPRVDAKEPLADEFVAVMHRAMAKKPADRFADAREMRLALEAAVGGAWAGTPSPRPGWRPPSAVAPAAEPVAGENAPPEPAPPPATAASAGAPAAVTETSPAPAPATEAAPPAAPTQAKPPRPLRVPMTRKSRPAVEPAAAKGAASVRAAEVTVESAPAQAEVAAPVAVSAARKAGPVPTRAARALSEALTPIPAALPGRARGRHFAAWAGLAVAGAVAAAVVGDWLQGPTGPAPVPAEEAPQRETERLPALAEPVPAQAAPPAPHAPEPVAPAPITPDPAEPAPSPAAPLAATLEPAAATTTDSAAPAGPAAPRPSATPLPSEAGDGDTARKPKAAPKARAPASRTSRDGPKLKMVD